MLRTESAVSTVVMKRLGAYWFIGVILASFGILFLIAFTRGPDMAQQLPLNADRCLILINICVLLLVTVVSATEIPYDISGRVLLVILSKPIRRYQYITGKFMGLLGVGLIYASLTAVFATSALLSLGYEPTAEYWTGIGVIFLRLLIACGFTTMLSASFSEIPTIAGAIAGGLFSFGINIVALMVIRSEASFPLKVAVSPLLYFIPSLQSLGAPPTALGDLLAGRIRNYDMVQDVTLDTMLESSLNSFSLASLYAVTYALFFLALAIIFFHRTEKVE